MVESHPYTARQIFQQIKEHGFPGGITIVEDYVRKVRPPRIKPFLELVFAPGECAQADWGSYGTVRVGSTTRRLSFFVITWILHSIMGSKSYPAMWARAMKKVWLKMVSGTLKRIF